MNEKLVEILMKKYLETYNEFWTVSKKLGNVKKMCYLQGMIDGLKYSLESMGVLVKDIEGVTEEIL